MTIIAYRRPRGPTVLEARVLMKIVATETRREIRSQKSNIAHVSQDVPVPGIQAFIVSLRKVHIVVLKQIVTSDEIVWIRQARRSGSGDSEMALRACRGNRLHISPVLLGKISQSDVACVVGVDDAVARVTIEPECSERLC